MNSDYQFINRIGEGAFSKVYLVQNKQGRQYALKISNRPDILKKEANIHKAVDMIFRENDSISEEFQECIYVPRFFAFWEEEGNGYLLMEYVQGINLEEYLNQEGGLGSIQTARIGLTLANGIIRMQQTVPPILFRDMKPSNIILTEEKVYLIDFGCACYLEHERIDKKELYAVAGTPGYAAPEQLDVNSSSGLYSDVYGLGRTMQRIVNNGKKLKRTSKESTNSVKIKCRHIDKKLQKIIEGCCRNRSEYRIPDCRWVKRLLIKYLNKQKYSKTEKAVLKGRVQFYEAERMI